MIMKIQIAKPPVIWEEVHKRFEIDDAVTIYTWGDTIYNPGNTTVTQELVEHESVHAKQQEAEGGPEIWWKRYIADNVFRATQEAEAYGRQHAYYSTQVTDRNWRDKHLRMLASFLASDLYKTGMTHSDAYRAIRDQSRKPMSFE